MNETIKNKLDEIAASEIEYRNGINELVNTISPSSSTHFIHSQLQILGNRVAPTDLSPEVYHKRMLGEELKIDSVIVLQLNLSSPMAPPGLFDNVDYNFIPDFIEKAIELEVIAKAEISKLSKKKLAKKNPSKAEIKQFIKDSIQAKDKELTYIIQALKAAESTKNHYNSITGVFQEVISLLDIKKQASTLINLGLPAEYITAAIPQIIELCTNDGAGHITVNSKEVRQRYHQSQDSNYAIAMAMSTDPKTNAIDKILGMSKLAEDIATRKIKVIKPDDVAKQLLGGAVSTQKSYWNNPRNENYKERDAINFQLSNVSQTLLAKKNIFSKTISFFQEGKTHTTKEKNLSFNTQSSISLHILGTTDNTNTFKDNPEVEQETNGPNPAV